VVIVIIFHEYRIQHNDFTDRNILTQDMDPQYDGMLYSIYGVEYVIPASKVLHSRLVITDFGTARDATNKCNNAREAVLFGISPLYKLLGSPESVESIKNEMENCKYGNPHQLLKHPLFMKYLARN
jgi:hypothetical protein